MPEQLNEATQAKIVELRKAGKTHREIQKETGHSPTAVLRALKKAGLTNPKPVATTPPATSGGNGLHEFQPPAPPPKKAEPVTVRLACCGVTVELEPGESINDLASKPCPACGEV